MTTETPKNADDAMMSSSYDEFTPDFFKSKVEESKLMEKYKLELKNTSFASKFITYLEFYTGPYLVTVGYDPVPAAVGVPDTWSTTFDDEKMMQDKKTGYFFYYCYDDDEGDIIAEIYGVKTMDELLMRMDSKLEMDDIFMKEIGLL